MIVSVWARQIRAPFLLLSVLLVSIGVAVAAAGGQFNWTRSLLAMVGVVLAHISVNLFNEISDHRTGIDHQTERTPFSGGSGMLQRGLTSPRAVRAVACATLAVALAVGLYLTWLSGWQLLLFVLAGGFATLLYTSHLSRWVLGELAAGTCLGSLVVLGTYFAQVGSLNADVVLIAIPPGILTSLLLLLNEFPDAEADREGGRRHLVVVFGMSTASMIYVAGVAITYLVLGIGALCGRLPGTVLITLLTAPLAFKACRHALRAGNDERIDIARMVPGLAANVGMVLGTDLLIAAAYIIQVAS